MEAAEEVAAEQAGEQRGGRRSANGRVGFGDQDGHVDRVEVAVGGAEGEGGVADDGLRVAADAAAADAAGVAGEVNAEQAVAHEEPRVEWAEDGGVGAGVDQKPHSLRTPFDGDDHVDVHGSSAYDGVRKDLLVANPAAKPHTALRDR